jgi:hypothetical protein
MLFGYLLEENVNYFHCSFDLSLDNTDRLGYCIFMLVVELVGSMRTKA